MARGRKTDEVEAALRAQLRSGRLRPGTEIQPTRLMEAHRCSMSPVMIALHRLAALGLVRIDEGGQSGRQFLAPWLSGFELLDISQTLQGLELAAIGLLAEGRPADFFEQLAAVPSDLRSTNGQPVEVFLEKLRAAQELILKATKNAYLERDALRYWDMVWPRMAAAFGEPGRRADVGGVYARLLDYLAAKRPEEAEKEMRNHIIRVFGLLIAHTA